MSADLDLISAKVESLALDELLLLQERIIAQVRQRTIIGDYKEQRQKEIEAAFAKITHPNPTPEQIEAYRARVFPTEIRAQMGYTDFSKIKIGPKTITQMIDEDREDRV